MSSSLGRRRRARLLDDEERRLWEKVAATVTPLEPARHVAAAEPEPEPPVAEEAPARPTPKREWVIVRPAPQTPRPTLARMRSIHVKHLPTTEGLPQPVAAPPSLAPLDDRTRRRLVRGTITIDARLDLHGLTQDAAHSALRRFLISARTRGARIALVITGKGRGGPTADVHDRGVLRRSVPHWLADPALRDVVIGFEEAHLAHGGAGAIYVRLRRARGAEEGTS
ncbi:MAG: Smr/MutS family protein [Siculibacillus sp.]